MWRRWSHTYSKTLNLPKSSLPNRPDRKLLSQRLDTVCDRLYREQLEAHKSKKQYILHDGPPYANGSLHLGHALNKVLKDMINRTNVLKDRLVHYVPGWDCHGLPIENASIQRARKKKVKLDTKVKKREAARALANEMIALQMEGFRSFAVMADWENPKEIYKTLSPDYEVRQLRVFADMMFKGLVFRQRKPVYWSVESGTALAESELQYGNSESTAVFVKYQLDGIDGSLVIWTTTPWTLPANRAVAVHKNIEYALIKTSNGNLLIASNLLDQVPHCNGGEVLQTFTGEELTQYRYKCPLTGEFRPIILADHVTDTSGTGLVHTAPGHGKEDYLAGMQHDIEVYCPVDGKGKYTDELADSLQDLVGLDARKEGTPRIVELLQETGAILDKSKIQHSVPFDWRSKTPVIIRSTPQFFVDLSDVRGLALEALDKVKFNPPSGKARLTAFTQSRSEWCISRQRVWGVPIPVLYHKHSSEVLMTPEVVNHIIDHIEILGSADSWFEEQSDISEWLPQEMRHLASEYTKCSDTMDVWFDSGTSWTQFEEKDLPVQYYLEGSDQHRGWFQSSLLTRIATTNRPQAPYSNLITHGFLLDEKMQKMSKSLGNVVLPKDLINGDKRFPAMGVDGLRLFIAQMDYTGDISLSPIAVNQVVSTLKKLRLTFKYLLGNLNDYTPGENVALSPLDRYALSILYQFSKDASDAFEEQNFSLFVKNLQIHMNSQLSSFYFDVSKDILYTEAPSSPRRIGIQYVLHQILEVYVRLLSPITPLLTQEIWEHSPRFVNDSSFTPALASWPLTNPSWKDEQLEQEFSVLFDIKKEVNDCTEKARSERKLGSSLGCDVYLNIEDEKIKHVLEKYREYLSEIFIVSHVHFSQPLDPEWSFTGKNVTVTNPSGHKCPRCWQFSATEEDTLCHKCEENVKIITAH